MPDQSAESTGIPLGSILGFLPDGALVVDDGGIVTHCNARAEEMFGFETGSLVGRTVEDLLPQRFRGGHESLRKGFVRSPHARAMGAGLDLYGLCGDGTEFPVDISLAPLETAEGPVTVAIVRDMTVRMAQLHSERLLLAQVQRQRNWLEAVSEVQVALLSGPSPEVSLALIAEKAAGLAEAVGAFVTVPSGVEGVVEVSAATRSLSPLVGTKLGETAPAGGTGGGGTPVFVGEGPEASGVLAGTGIAGGPVLVLPLRSGNGVVGTLTIVGPVGSGGFEGEAIEMVEVFGTQAGLALDLARARSDRERLLVFADRDRIARDLHDHVIQRIFATGLGLQAAAGRVTDEHALERINHAVDELDAAIRELRTAIFELESRPSSAATRASGVRERLLEVATRASEGLGFQPVVRFSGEVDLRVEEALASDVLAVTREALSNAAKYARARSVEVSVDVGDDVVVVVLDDGRGIGMPTRSSGLDNLRSRAESHGGTLQVGDRDSGGTRLEWRVPLRRG